jgi:hypothetical protein
VLKKLVCEMILLAMTKNAVHEEGNRRSPSFSRSRLTSFTKVATMATLVVAPSISIYKCCKKVNKDSVPSIVRASSLAQSDDSEIDNDESCVSFKLPTVGLGGIRLGRLLICAIFAIVFRSGTCEVARWASRWVSMGQSPDTAQ